MPSITNPAYNRMFAFHPDTPTPTHKATVPTRRKQILLRKEVIQPHLPVRLPCYDFVPIASPTFDHSPPPKVG